MKCGTSSVRNYIGRLPEFRVLPAEGGFFDNDLEYTKGLKYYISKYGAEESIKNLRLGEKSVDYSFHPLATERIKKAYPDVKLLWLLRDPVTRTYSNYLHELKRGIEWLDFDAALQRELKGDAINPLHCYINKSKYSKQIERFVRCFHSQQILFLSFEELKYSPAITLTKIHD